MASFDPDKHRTAWASLSRADRRRILRGVNRGEALEDPREALLALGIARNQMRFWRWAWLLGPLTALLRIGDGAVTVAANAVVGSLVLGGMSWFFHRRAKRAYTRNEEMARSRSKSNKPRKKKRG